MPDPRPLPNDFTACDGKDDEDLCGLCGRRALSRWREANLVRGSMIVPEVAGDDCPNFTEPREHACPR